VLRELETEVPAFLQELSGFVNPKMVMPGIAVLQSPAFTTYNSTAAEMKNLDEQLQPHTEQLKNIPFIIVADDADFVSERLNNFLWIAFTRCNPSHDIYGIDSSTVHKHWGCKGPLVMDARIKPHHAPPLIKDAAVEKSVDKLFEKGGSLYGMA
jgi:4-hydroxy-3-polyprenylbenzoate decarboxylase